MFISSSSITFEDCKKGVSPKCDKSGPEWERVCFRVRNSALYYRKMQKVRKTFDDNEY